MRVFVTGAAGFIGHALTERLLSSGDKVFGLDNLSSYYDVALKQHRLDRLRAFSNFTFEQMDVADKDRLANVMRLFRPDIVVHLAAQAGVRYSLTEPFTYTHANVTGFLSMLEAVRHQPVAHLVYASSSSVYGSNGKLPFATSDAIDHPLSLYAATKRANELMAHAYSHLFKTPTTGLRFFTVYGPLGRPDMAVFGFAEAILAGKPIQVFNHGQQTRDLTYVDDVVEGIVRVMGAAPRQNPAWKATDVDPSKSNAPFGVFNIGNKNPVKLLDLITSLERALGKTATKQFVDAQPGDVTNTFADMSAFEKQFGPLSYTPIDQGVAAFVSWYLSYVQGAAYEAAS